MQAAEGEKRDATPDLLLKHLDVILATYERRQTKHLQKHVKKTLYKYTQHPNKTLATYVWGITPDTHRVVHGPSHQGGPAHKNQATLGTTQVALRRKTA
jgi:hypothetical protein